MTCRLVAEISGNHLGSVERMHRLVKAAINAGADAVKLQTFTPEQMADLGAIVQAGPWAGCNLVDLYRRTHIPREWYPELFALGRRFGVEVFSSVFHPDDVDFLEILSCPRYKIASFELTDHALIRRVARTGKPIIISTGMATEEEIKEAAEAALNADGGCLDVTLLKCTTAYPAPASEANLRAMYCLPAIPRRPPGVSTVRYGLSDHTLGIGVAVAAAALGASMIEKHLTLSRADGGPDAGFSMEPHEFGQLVLECRRAEQAIGEVRYGPTEEERAYLPLRRAPGGKRGGG